MLWISGDTTPCFAAIVRVVCSRVAVAESAARCTANRARPGSGDIVVGRGDNPVRVVRIYSDDWFVLARGSRVLVNGYIWGLDRLAVEIAGQDE